jgi:hypothetical protein
MSEPECFVGEMMKCSLCDFEKKHTAGSGWLGGVVGLEGKPKHRYYMCPTCLTYVVSHPDPRDPPDMTACLDPSKGIVHKPNRDYGLAFLGTFAMQREIEIDKRERSAQKQ